MDIKQVLNATAAVTLGKDMVFRDYAQVPAYPPTNLPTPHLFGNFDLA